ncbi:MAG: TetR/AcrR family transcriptional regulator [Ignavibacteria bacterium]|nr:TetR/AcrR family transcriptional regulator [Ignavibacteria bacterium]
MSAKRNRGRPSIATETNQEDLLKSALKAFASNGFEGTNVKKLGQEAGIAPSLFYYHFKDKIGLWKAAVQQEARTLEREMALGNTENNSSDPIELLMKWMGGFIQFSAKHPEFHQVISYEMANPSARADWLLEQVLKPLHTDFQNQITILQDIGIIKKMPMAHFVSIVIGAANIFFSQAYQMEKLYGVNVFDQKVINQHTETIIELLLKGILIENK